MWQKGGAKNQQQLWNHGKGVINVEFSMGDELHDAWDRVFDHVVMKMLLKRVMSQLRRMVRLSGLVVR